MEVVGEKVCFNGVNLSRQKTWKVPWHVKVERADERPLVEDHKRI